MGKKLRFTIFFICFSVLLLSTLFFPSVKAETNAAEETAYQVIGRYKIAPGMGTVKKMELSTDGKKLVYALKSSDISVNFEENFTVRTTTTSSKTVLMINDKQVSPVYFDIVDFYLSPDGKNVGYVFSNIVNNQERYGLNFNGRELATGYSERPKYTYNKDGSKLVYWFQGDNGYQIMANGEKIDSLPEWLIEELKARPKPYTGKLDGVTPGEIFVVEKPGGSELIYTVSCSYKLFQSKSYLIRNGQKVLDGIMNITKIIVSPDGTNIACLVQDKGKYYMALNDRIVSPAYKGVNAVLDIFFITREIKFSGDGKKLFYVMKDKKWFIMMNDQKISEAYDKIVMFLKVNMDGSEISYLADKDGRSVHQSIRIVNGQILTSEHPEINSNSNQAKLRLNIIKVGKEEEYCLMVDEKPITPQFSQLEYNKTLDGRVFFAGYDLKNREIIHGVFKLQ